MRPTPSPDGGTEFRSLPLLFRRQADRLGPRPAVRVKRYGLYTDVSWDRYQDDVKAAALAIIRAGIEPGDRVGILSENRYEWLVADLAALSAGAVTVPLHTPLTPKQIQFQLADAGVRLLFVSDRAQLEKAAQIKSSLPDLRGIVVFAGGSAGDDTPAVTAVTDWPRFLQGGFHETRGSASADGAELSCRADRLGPDDLATIIYTSGTTGFPKGVMLTHGNLLSNATAALAAMPFDPGAVMLNWLPLSHIYARLCDHYHTLAAGSVLALAESPETLADDLRQVRPTHLHGVPRFYEKVLLLHAHWTGEERGRRLRAFFGDRIEWLGAGGAPLSVAVGEAYQAAGFRMLPGYGLTETSPIVTFNPPDRCKLGTVGVPLPGVDVGIAPDGEVLTRGPNVMKGYWRNPAATAETIRDGWLHTGDLGRIDADGYLSITGRKKELLVLSNGKKVVPNHIEGLLTADECVDQAVVHGEGRNFITALIVPHWENLRRHLGALAPGDDWRTHPAAVECLRARIDAALADVADWEKVRRFVVLPEPFTVAREELTVSLKIRRSVIVARHQAALDALYHSP